MTSYSICTHPECNKGYLSEIGSKRNVCGIHKYPLLAKCFFCGESSLTPEDTFCTFCGVNIKETMKDVLTIFFIAKVVAGVKLKLHPLTPVYVNRVNEDYKEYFPVMALLEAGPNGKHSIDENLNRELRKIEEDDFNDFLDKFSKKNKTYLTQ
ncbi:hypothetical protein [Leptospira sarikeiensis]|uniref:Zinc ribbon domain-containing protein n=1 Tax=Leptospira sarikeiensis TaxID=2484943 RepID=A0A4R9K6E5_9LEPT|nr:hypothetical protein [Leptospira sarikeiensis]TGL61161.1 hypothetical protein EHQ64_11115 [Leptospira sarikeiensis]